MDGFRKESLVGLLDIPLEEFLEEVAIQFLKALVHQNPCSTPEFFEENSTETNKKNPGGILYSIYDTIFNKS